VQVLYQAIVKDAEPSLSVYKNGAALVTVNPKSSPLKDRIVTLIEHIGYSPGTKWADPISDSAVHSRFCMLFATDCPDEASLSHYFNPVDYKELLADVEAYTTSQRDYVSNTANISSIIWHAFHDANRLINWAGFYFVRPLVSPLEGESHVLVLGPFQGKKACHTIHYDEGVCGKAARTKTVQRIADVHSFEGHIACDSASESEIVVPVLNDKGELLAVLDMDCPVKNGFSKEDERQLMHIAKIVAERSDWHNMVLPYHSSGERTAH
jgi:L-methionine (R)-S-oxide reductase